MTRKYELKKRAATQQQTRQRIVEAAVELHETVGPAQTTISAIAERAGVQRLTVYRHFPDDESVFRACTRHWYEGHPPPDPSAWESIRGPSDRLRTALADVYAYFRHGEPMLTRGTRDLPHVPALAKIVSEFEMPYWERVRQVLIDGWAVEGEQRDVVTAAIAHATLFSTWQSLVRDQGLSEVQAVELFVCLVRCVAAR
jgi:AcrR family transcriptional regulator